MFPTHLCAARYNCLASAFIWGWRVAWESMMNDDARQIKLKVNYNFISMEICQRSCQPTPTSKHSCSGHHRAWIVIISTFLTSISMVMIMVMVMMFTNEPELMCSTAQSTTGCTHSALGFKQIMVTVDIILKGILRHSHVRIINSMSGIVTCRLRLYCKGGHWVQQQCSPTMPGRTTWTFWSKKRDSVISGKYPFIVHIWSVITVYLIDDIIYSLPTINN